MTLALAIGANTAIFSVVNGVLLKPLPFKDPDGLVRVTNLGLNGTGYAPSSVPDFLDFRAQSKTVPMIAAVDQGPVNLTGGVEPERITSGVVSANFFTILGVTPVLGRGFVDGEDGPDGARVAVLSDRLWRRRFNADPRIVGKTIAIDGNQTTVVGVAPASLNFPEGSDLWRPFRLTSDISGPDNRGAHFFGMIGRLAPGSTPELANTEIASIAKRLQQQYPESNTGFDAGVVTLQKYLVGDVQPALFAMLGAVGFVLLIACANVANLLLVRAAGRETEMAVRTALGAGRWRIMRQLVTESVILALVGGAVGVLLASWGVELLLALAPRNVPRLREVRVDGTVLLFTFGVAILTGMIFGLIPAFHAARADVSGMLKEGARGSSGSRASRRVRSALVITEMALAVVLLVGAGLLLRSFAKRLAIDPGFRADRVMTFNVSAPETKYGQRAQLRRLADDILTRMKAVPGYQSEALVSGLPLGTIGIRTSVHITGTPPERPSERKRNNLALVTPGYFATMGIPLVRGRDFTAEDRSGAPMVAIVNQEFVKRYVPTADPLTKQIEEGWEQDTVSVPGVGDTASVTLGGQIIGVVGNVRRQSLEAEIMPETYVAWTQPTLSEFAVVVRSSADPSTVMSAIRSQMRSVDADLPISDLRQLKELVSQSVSRPRFYTTLLGAFASIALLLAAVGIYGVISYTVTQRTRELGIRIALGASRGVVIGTVLREGLGLAIGGLAIGLVGAYWVTKLISGLLFGVPLTDPLTFAGVAALLTGVAAVACYVPARRAAKVDPVIAMRAE
jgi:predicted permease